MRLSTMPWVLNRAAWIRSVALFSSTLKRLEMSESFTDTPLLTPRFDAALHHATRHHSRQLRKGTPIPYAAHLLAASSLVLEMHGDEDEAIGALLHDARMRRVPDDLTAYARIRNAALELFAARGTAATTIRDVAKAAGVSPGLVQHYFGTKAGLQKAVDEFVVADALSTITDLPDGLEERSAEFA